MKRSTDAQQARQLRLARNAPNVYDGRKLLLHYRGCGARVVFLDPQYRGLLDQMKYGHEGKNGRTLRRSLLPQMDDAMITDFVRLAGMALDRNGYLFLWIDKHGIGTGRHLNYFATSGSLRIVDVIHWRKTRMGMGARTRALSEYLIVGQKEPQDARSTWSDRAFIDSHTEGVDWGSDHPHVKPHQLIRKLVLATTKRGDLVIDPCAGSYTVLDVCRDTGREFVGCDLIKPT